MQSKFLLARKVMLFVIPVAIVAQVFLVLVMPYTMFLIAAALVTWMLVVFTAVLIWFSPGQQRTSLATFGAAAGALCVGELHLIENIGQTELVLGGVIFAIVLIGSIFIHRSRGSLIALLVTYYTATILLTAINFSLYHAWFFAILSGISAAVFLTMVVWKKT